jgi:hypothetical protein
MFFMRVEASTVLGEVGQMSEKAKARETVEKSTADGGGNHIISTDAREAEKTAITALIRIRAISP